jgi:DNA invertase Pin-like site-specific DNA recombinase
MKVYYLRVSTIEQNTARQMEEVPEGCKVFEDKVSGSVPFFEREQGSIIFNLIKQRQINTIYVHSIDRLGRNSLDILQTIQFFNEYEVNLISKKEGLQTFIEGKPNAIASLMIGILSTLSEFELSRIKERSKEGIAEAKKRGAYANNGGNKRIESIEEFMNKESSKKVVKQLKKGFSVRDCAGICGCSVSLVMKVKKLVEDSESTSKKVLISEPTKKTIETTTKETRAKKKEIALQVYAQREAIRKQASEWLNINKVETPKTILNETEEERKEWERMEREQNK